MVWGDDRGVKCKDGVTRHPYEAYDPKFGWHMAVRIEGDNTMGRALCMTQPIDGKKYFVRSYLRPANATSYSQTDDGMDTWLKEQGYTKENYWEDGERMAYHEASDHFLAPYLDGGEKRVSIDERNKALVIDSDGEYACDQTGGYPTYDNDEDYFECDDCGDRTSNDDGYWVGRQEDTQVCDSCRNDNYQYVYGRRGHQYYVHEDNVVYVESSSEHYDQDYLGDNNIVELENGDYEEMDNAVEVDGEWYHLDDERICRTEDTDEFKKVDEGCWQCAESGNWYTDDCEDYTEYEGERYHDDYIPKRIADATADERIDEDEGMPTMLTMEMLSLTHMLWDYSISMHEVTVSLTYVLDGKKLYAERIFLQEFVNGVDRSEFNRFLRNELCSALMAQANEIANKYLETQGE
jgi:hypothetical protein